VESRARRWPECPMKSCIDIRSAARNVEGGALVVVLGIAKG